MTTPWWQALPLRDEVASNAGNIDDVQMSLYRAVYGQPPAPYGDPAYYGAITHPTATLVSLMSRIAVRLGGQDHYQSVRALYHLDQGMGGGKSHGLIGLYHLAKNPGVLAATDIGQAAWQEAKSRLGGAEPELSGTHVVVISADHMTPFAPDSRPDMDGPARTLWERFLWRLIGHDYNLFTRFQGKWDQEGIREALREVGRPLLILIDEIMDYVRQLDDGKYANERQSELAFLKALFDAVNDVPHVAMVVVMISTERDKGVYGPLAQSFRDEIQGYLVRNGTNTAVSEAGDFAQIIRRRLFKGPASPSLVVATATAFGNTNAQWQTTLSRVPGADVPNFATDVARSYPFHPDLLRLVEKEWANLAGYQRVRSTVTLFAQTTYLWARRAQTGNWAPLLIGPGDVPLDQAGVREALLGSGVIESETTVANYRQVIATDIVGEGGKGGVAAAMDQERTDTWKHANPYASQRMATALLLYSLATRAGGKLGAVDAELKAASFVPDPVFAATDAETVFNALRDPDTGLGALDVIGGAGGQPPRYQLTTRQTLQMLFRAQRAAISDKERDGAIAEAAERLMNKGSGFAKIRFVSDDLDGKGQRRSDKDILADLDEKDATRLIILDPSRWTLLNGRDDETRRAIRMAFGVGTEALPVTHAASLVIACVNTQRRATARSRAAEYLAWLRVSRIQVVLDDQGLKAQSDTESRNAKAALDKEVRRAFQHYAYLLRDAQNALEVRFDKFDDDTKTALSGANIWDQLVVRGRAVVPGGLNMDGLLLAVKDELPRSLSELAALFWTNPRMPMLASASELRQALFAAIESGKVELLNAEGTVATTDRPSDLPLGSSSVMIRFPLPIVPPDNEVSETGGDYKVGGEQGARNSQGNHSQSGGGRGNESHGEGTTPTVARAKQWLKFQTDLSNENSREKVMNLLNRLRNIIDDGDIESCIITFDLIGNEDRLKEYGDLAKPLTGTQQRLEDLPD